MEPRRLFATYVVNTVFDIVPGSLRQAILDANANPGVDQINFNIPLNGVQTILPTSPLPPITDTVFLDATTQPRFFENQIPLIRLDGSLAGAGADGVVVNANNVFVQGLAINRFTGNGIVVNGDANFIALNVVGASPTSTDPTVVDRPGLLDRGNLGDGVVIRGNNNLVLNNVLAFNHGNGVTLVSGVRNDVALNSYFSNLKLGIDLGGDGRTLNDRDDGDSGPNDLLNFPIITSIFAGGSATSVFGKVQTAPNRKVSITLYSSPTPDGQGRTVLTPASISMLTDDTGAANFSANFPTTLAFGYITAVAASNPSDVDQFPDVSEFSPPVAVPTTVPPRVSDVYVDGSGWSAPFSQYVADSGRGDAAVGLRFPARVSATDSAPWLGVDTISLGFDQQIALANSTVTIAGVKKPTYTVQQFSYNQDTHIATYRLDGPIPTGERLTITLSGAVASADGAALDGNFDGTPGGNYQRVINILPGDVDRNGAAVNAGDIVVARNHVGQNVNSSGAATLNYDPFIDINTDLNINASDLVLIRNRVGQTASAAGGALFGSARITPGRDRVLTRLQAGGVLA